MNASILITGGAGFIGSALLHALNARGEKNILITDLEFDPEKERHLAPLHYQERMSARELLLALSQNDVRLSALKTIFHLGACSSTTETNRDFLMSNNFEYTRTLAAWALQRGVRFVYASSAATYGDGSRGMQDGIEGLDQLRPLNLYGESKQLFDLYARDQGWLDRIVGLKYFNVFGPNESHKKEMRSLVCKAYEQIQETGKMRLFKSYRPEYRDGEQKRDFIYVKDAVAMTLHLAETKSASGLFNIGAGVASTWLDLAKALFVALEREPVIEFIEMPSEIREQYQYYTCADITRLRATGYVKEITLLEEAVRDYVCGYLMPGKNLGEK
ncbi:MAG: ADP-glyceromanno-heptose 6-epimerase [Chthoniobacterales bacterium]|nr:ADP-glyceromanno-heptose 6-epimerase [Chthoniobacterales bacterium]